MSCTLTLAGACATKLSDVYTFITNLKDLDLKGENRYTCCNDGSSVLKGINGVTEDCQCPENLAATQR